MEGEWVLVGAKRRDRKPRGPRRSASGHSKSVASVDTEPFDRDARVPEARQRAVLARVRRISAALVAQTASASLVVTALRAVAIHVRWATDTDSDLKRRLHIVSYGLGSFCSSSNAIYQLAFVNALVEAATRQHGELDTVLEIYDPVMNASDREIAAELGIVTIDENEGGKRVAAKPTVFFMPHCGHSLYQNVVVANHEASTLQNTLIIGNSFGAYSDRLIDSAARAVSIILGVLPFVTETALPLGVSSSHDEFPLYEAAFNDLSVHTFSSEQATAAHASKPLQTLVTNVRGAPSATTIDRELIV